MNIGKSLGRLVRNLFSKIRSFNIKLGLLRVLLILFSTGLSIVFFFVLVDLARQYTKLSEGLAALGAYFLVIPISILELGFIFFISSSYQKAAGVRDLMGRFVLVTGIQGLLFTLEEILRIVIYIPVFRFTGVSFVHFLNPFSYVSLIGGLLLGISMILLRILVFKTREKPP